MQISRRRKAFLFTVTGIILLTTSTLISYAIDAARFVITERPGEIFFFSSRTRPLTGFIFHSTDYGRAPSLPAMEPLPDPDFEPRLLYYHQRSNALIIRGLVGDGGPETRYIRISHDYGQTFDYERNNIRVLSPRLYPHSDSLLFCNGADKWSYDTLQTSVEYPMDGVPRTHTSSTRTIWDNIQIVGLKTLEADREENPFDLRVFYSQDRAHTTQYAENDGWPFWYEYPPDAIYSGYQSGELWMTWLNDLYHTTDWGDNWTLLQQFRGEDEFAVDLT
ncbi:hypothetical protein K8I28_03685, partial [bacterium]|nr:hypothetical protein [bacterium]